MFFTIFLYGTIFLVSIFLLPRHILWAVESLFNSHRPYSSYLSTYQKVTGNSPGIPPCLIPIHILDTHTVFWHQDTLPVPSHFPTLSSHAAVQQTRVNDEANATHQPAGDGCKNKCCHLSAQYIAACHKSNQHQNHGKT